METERDLNLCIMNLTLKIQEVYPELYRNLSEMHATLPISEVPVISSIVLKKWFDSLEALVRQYSLVRNVSTIF